jgi:hypothetical protein
VTDDPKLIVLLTSVFAVVGVVIVGGILIQEGATTGMLAALAFGVVSGSIVGLRLRIPDGKASMGPGTAVTVTLAGLGVASTLRIGPSWIAVGVMSAATVFLVAMGVRRLRHVSGTSEGAAPLDPEE